jgi:phosphonate transport system substrate-binding protein
MKKLVAVVLAAVMMAGLSTVAVAAEKTVNWGILAVESQDDLINRWGPFLKSLEKKTGLTIKPFFAADYTGVIEAMRCDKGQIAWFGNKSAIEAVNRANGEVFVQTVCPVNLTDSGAVPETTFRL